MQGYDDGVCNRFRILKTNQLLVEAFDIARDLLNVPLPGEFFPGSRVPIVRQGQDGRELIDATWGIQLGKHRVTNSRDDKIDTVWRRFMGNRVVFPIDQAVEWHYDLDLLGQPVGKPRPWVIERVDGGIAAVAGIADGDCVSMMTCPADGVYAQVHNKSPDDPRMLVYLPAAQDISDWLDDNLPPRQLKQMLHPAPDPALVARPLNQ